MSLEAALRLEREAQLLADEAITWYRVGTARFNTYRGINPELARDGLLEQSRAMGIGDEVKRLRKRAQEELDAAIQAEQRHAEFLETRGTSLHDPEPRSHDGGTLRTRRGNRARQRGR